MSFTYPLSRYQQPHAETVKVAVKLDEAGLITLADKPSDPVMRPDHYARWPIEPIRFIMENKLPFAVGNIIKYVVRYPFKNGIEDLRKARRMIDLLIEKEEADAAGRQFKITERD